MVAYVRHNGNELRSIHCEMQSAYTLTNIFTEQERPLSGSVTSQCGGNIINECFLLLYVTIWWVVSVCFAIPCIIFALLFLSLLVVTQIRGQIRLSSPLPITVRALYFYRENISALPSSTCVELCLPTLGALSNC